MKFALVTDPVFREHRSAQHVERPERLEAIEQALAASALKNKLTAFPARRATDEELLSCHLPRVLRTVAELTAAGGGQIDADTYVNESSDEAARRAVGGGIDLCQAILDGEFQRGFLAARPPGHHATPERSMGFCLYSTIAIAAKHCAAQGKRVLVLDWDVHHGNGTQDCLYAHPGSCFISIHQSPFYPGTGYSDERGVGEGEGLTYNVPLPAGSGDAEYGECYRTLVRPIIRRYEPEIILVSAGYDAHHQDLLGGMNMTAAGFGQLATWLAEDAEAGSAQGRLVGFLEGGYHLGGLAESVLATLNSWTSSSSAKSPDPGKVKDSVQRRIQELASAFFA